MATKSINTKQTLAYNAAFNLTVGTNFIMGKTMYQYLQTITHHTGVNSSVDLVAVFNVTNGSYQLLNLGDPKVANKPAVIL